MTDRTLRTIGELMDAAPQAGSFAARRTSSPRNLAIEVDGVGPILLPVTPTQARQLCAVSQPAQYGLRDRTLLDPNVRDTWTVPRERVTVDERQWHETLLPMLDVLRADLGLAPDCELSAELHSMLVYEPGQFFKRHQDSKKADGMIGTLVVTLPSEFTGGELVIEQQGARVTDQGSPEDLSLVAFYGDCEHEVQPVVDGFRITLTYNLMVKGRSGPDTGACATDPSVLLLAEQLREHFTTPVESSMRPPGHDQPAKNLPRKLVYLLNHQYPRHEFGWEQLTGGDAARTAMMLAAADIAGYDASLALAEVEHLYDEDYTIGMLIHRERWERVENGWKCVERSEVDFDDDGEMIEPIPDDPQNIPVRSHPPLSPESDEVGELRWSNVTLTWLVDRSGAAGEPDAREYVLKEEELCTGGSKSMSEAFASELEGYMGNEGNTASFWYKRAAVVIMPGR